MRDLTPHTRQTLKEHAFFATTLGGFADSDGNFKAFGVSMAPLLETEFITIDQTPGDQNVNSEWASPSLVFTVHGPKTSVQNLWTIARKIHSIFKAATSFALVKLNFTANATSNVCTSTKHQFFDGDIVNLFTSGTLPGGLSGGTDYYIVNATLDTYQLSSTFGGAAIDISSAGTGTHTAALKPIDCQVVGDALFSQGEDPVTEMLTVSVALQFGIAD